MVGPILERLDGLELVPTYWEPDGEFPDHEPNPLLPENREFIIRKVRDEGADLGIAWDGDADRCFFIDETGEFVAGDFLTALLAESVLQKRPGAEILYDIRASRAVADTVEAAGGRALVNRVGHAFFKTRMRDEGGAFGGEVSGHYYFADFYNADSGTIPALLILELLGQTGKTMSELLAPYRSNYFISGEINSEVEDQAGEDAADQGALRGRRPARARRHLGRLRRLALQRAAVEHRAAAAPHARVAGLPGGHGGQARRGAAASSARDPLASRSRRRSGRAGQLLPDRGRPADAGRRRAELGQGAGRARALARRPRPPDRGPAADRHHPPAHRPPRAGRHPRPPLERRGLRARPARAGDRGLRLRRGAQRRARRGADAAPRDPARRRHRAALGVALVPRLGRLDQGHDPARRRLRARVRRPHAAGPAPPRPLAQRHALPRPRAARADRRRPPDRPHLLQPADLAPAGRQVRRARRRAPARADHLHALDARDARDGRSRSSIPATASRSPTT